MSDKKATLLDRFFEWREKHIPQNRFVLILSFLVGVVSALAAFTLKVNLIIMQFKIGLGLGIFFHRLLIGKP